MAMTKDEALKLALEALEEVVKWYQVRDKNDEPLPVHNQNPEIKASIEAITAIKEALAQPEQKRPPNCGTGYCSCLECLFEQAEQEPDALDCKRAIQARGEQA